MQPELSAPTVTVAMTAPIEVASGESLVAGEPEAAAPKTETFTMKDEPDLNLTDKELDMVVKAVGLKAKKGYKKKKSV